MPTSHYSNSPLNDFFPDDPVGRKLKKILRLYHQKMQETRDLERKLENYTFLYEVGQAMVSILDLEKLLVIVMDTAIQATKAKRGFLMLKDDSGNLEIRIARHFDQISFQDEKAYEFSRSVALRVCEEAEPVYLTDAADDTFYSHKTSILKLDLRSIMCAPLKTREKIHGVIYVDSRTVMKYFEHEDLVLFESLANYAAIAIENAMLYNRLKEKNVEEERTRRLAAMGRMASGIAHEIRNPLGIISNAAYFLKSTETEDDSDRTEQYEIIDAEIKRSNRLIDEMLQFARTPQLELEDCQLNVLLAQTIDAVKHSERFNGIKIIFSPDGALPEWRCDPGQLRQVFLNIMVNGADACGGKGTLTVKTRYRGEYCLIFFQDTGPGISPEHLPKIFDPFFTTKSHSKGTGLGLAISHGIIERHGGSLTAKSSSAGATFRIRLPFSS